MQKVRIAMIGAGAHASSVHYPSISSIEHAEITSVCDLDRERLKEIGEKYRIQRLYTDYREMLDKEELDAIYVIMPPHHLYDIVIDCLKENLNVFIEKPPGVTTNQIRSLSWFAQKHRCKTMVGFNRRFIPLMRTVKAIVEKRGPINQCVSEFYKNINSEEPPYYRGAVDVLTSDVIHAVDALRWMGGAEVREVRSSVRKLSADYHNSFNAIVSFTNGTVGILMANWVAGSRIHTFQMHSRGISAFINPNDKASIYSDNKAEPEVISTFDAAGGSREPHRYYGFFDENRHFVECLLQEIEPETCFSDAAKTMELVDLIYKNSIE